MPADPKKGLGRQWNMGATSAKVARSPPNRLGGGIPSQRSSPGPVVWATVGYWPVTKWSATKNRSTECGCGPTTT